MSDYRFKLGMFLPELGLPFDEGLARAKEIGADSVWFTSIADEPPIAEMSDAEAGRMAARVAKHGLELHVIAAGAPFKQLHLADLDLDTMQDDPAFRKEFDDLVRSMQIAVHLGIKTVNTFTFAWPGEYGAGKPTWPMRWLTRGGVIADVDMEKLLKAFSLVAQEGRALRRRRVALHDAVGTTPTPPATSGGWSSNSARRASRSCGVRRTASTAGRRTWRRPATRICAPISTRCTSRTCTSRTGCSSISSTDPWAPATWTISPSCASSTRNRSEAVLAMATHYRPPSGSREEAMRTNYAQLKQLISRVSD